MVHRSEKRKSTKLSRYHLDRARAALDEITHRVVFHRSPMNRAVTSAMLELKRRRA